MMATTGAVYWHWWHTQGPFAERNGTVERMHHVAAMGAGVNDLRYYVALADAIEANRTGPAADVAAEAEDWLDGIFAHATGDHDTHLLPYNGVPWDWGDVAFYDRWRETMKEYLLALTPAPAAASGPQTPAPDKPLPNLSGDLLAYGRAGSPDTYVAGAAGLAPNHPQASPEAAGRPLAVQTIPLPPIPAVADPPAASGQHRQASVEGAAPSAPALDIPLESLAETDLAQLPPLI
jgi:hypothetical protein